MYIKSFLKTSSIYTTNHLFYSSKMASHKDTLANENYERKRIEGLERELVRLKDQELEWRDLYGETLPAEFVSRTQLHEMIDVLERQIENLHADFQKRFDCLDASYAEKCCENARLLEVIANLQKENDMLRGSAMPVHQSPHGIVASASMSIKPMKPFLRPETKEVQHDIVGCAVLPYGQGFPETREPLSRNELWEYGAMNPTCHRKTLTRDAQIERKPPMDPFLRSGTKKELHDIVEHAVLPYGQGFPETREQLNPDEHWEYGAMYPTWHQETLTRDAQIEGQHQAYVHYTDFSKLELAKERIISQINPEAQDLEFEKAKIRSCRTFKELSKCIQ